MQEIAFFDVDKTLLRINSGAAWLKFERRAGRLGFVQLARAVGALVRYSLGATNIEPTLRHAIKSQAGQCAQQLQERTDSFLESEVIPTIRPQAMECLRAHQASGTLCVLLTTSTQFLAEPLGRYVGADAVLSTRLEVGEDGCLTGRPVDPLCFGEGKVTLAQEYAEKVAGTLAGATFYSDSYSDLPMLSAVGSPIVVCPDGRLRRHAAGCGWPIMEWDR